MIKHQIWEPDTCGCRVEEEYDPDNPSVLPVCNKVIRKCSTHASVPDNELYGVLYSNPDGENKVKNMVHRLLLGHDEIKDLGLEQKKQQSDGSEITDFKDGIKYNWSFSGSGKTRKLIVKVTGVEISKVNKQKIKKHCDTVFGIDKVEVV